MLDIQRVTGFFFHKINRVGQDNSQLEVYGNKAEAYKAFEARQRDGRDDVLIDDKSSKNYFLMSGDRLDFTTIGQGNKVKLGQTDGKVVKVDAEGQDSYSIRREEGNFLFRREVEIRSSGAWVETVTEKEDKKHLADRMRRDGRDNLLIQDDKSDNVFMVSADRIDFTSVGVGQKVKVGQTEGKIISLDDEP